MKIAFLLSGGPRFKYGGLFKLIDALQGWDQADFFIRTWKTEEYGRTSDEFVSYLKSNGLDNKFNYPVVQILDDVAEHHPQHIPLNLAHWAPNFLTMWWGIMQVNELRKNYQAQHGNHYDLIIRMRTDMLPGGNIDLRDYVVAAQTKLFTANNFSENFVIGGEQNYDLFVNYWKHLSVLSQRGTFIHPENSLEEYYNECGIPYDRVPVNVWPAHYRDEYKVRPF